MNPHQRASAMIHITIITAGMMIAGGGPQVVAAQQDFDASSYARNVSLDPNVDVFWTVDANLGTIKVAVHAKAATGWAGLGVSEMGGMEGADIVYYETGTGNVTDAHAIVAGTPVTDECTQDWTLVSAEAGTDGLVFEAERALDTGDSQDHVFVDDSADDVLPTRLLVAWGDSETIGYHATNFAKAEAVLYGGVENSNTDPILELTTDPDVPFFDVTAKNFTVPTNRTHYENSCIPRSELPVEEFHAIGFEGIIQASTSKYVHHLTLTAYTGTHDCGQDCIDWVLANLPDDDDPSSQSAYSDPYTFNNMTIPDFCYQQFANIFAWAPGAADVQLPGNVGFRFGNDSYTSLRVETHYNNLDGDAGEVDSSGVRVYYTEDIREMDMGVITLGDPNVDLIGTKLPEGKSSVEFNCPGACTETYFDAESVTVYSHFLHMHENGQRMETRQYRSDSDGNEQLVDATEVEYYSFLQAGGHVTAHNGSDIIQKGDRFETTCYYDTSLSSVDSTNVTFGEGSEQEMCMDFLFYYPAQIIPDGGYCGGLERCGGSFLGITELEDETDFNRTFGIVDSCTGTLDEDEQNDGTLSTDSSSFTTLGLGLSAFTMAVALSLTPCVVDWLA
ncbi:unnamed protein product [Ectocarpus sp. 12 AP-2014]